MNVVAIRQALRQEPFLPFQLRLADGRAFHVNHPEFVAVSPSNNRVVAFTGHDDSMAILEPLLIISLDYGPPPTANTGSASGLPSANGGTIG
jgi:hypothetical protein